MIIPLLFLLECMGIEIDASNVPPDATVHSIRLLETHGETLLCSDSDRLPGMTADGATGNGGVLLVGEVLPPRFAKSVEHNNAGDKSAHGEAICENAGKAYFLVNKTSTGNAGMRLADGLLSVNGSLNPLNETSPSADGASPEEQPNWHVIVTQFDVRTAFNHAVDTCLRFQEWSQRFNTLLQDAANANELMRACSRLFGNAAYMVDSSFKVIAIDDSRVFCEISHIWKHLVDEGYLPFDIVYSMQKSRELDAMSRSKSASICESEHFNNPFINFNLASGDAPTGHFFVVGYQKHITPGEVALADLIGEQLSQFVERLGMSRSGVMLHDSFVTRLMEDAPVGKEAIKRQIAPWDWNISDTLRIIAIDDTSGDNSLLDVMVMQLDHELGIKAVIADGSVVGIANETDIEALPGRSFEGELVAFLEKRHCIAGMSDAFAPTACNGALFRQARHALTCLRYERRGGLEANASLQMRDARPLLRFSECFTESLVHHLRACNALNEYADSRIRNLAEHDAKYGTEYVKTLEVYLENERRLNEAARKLFAHRNTLLYRIQRLKEMLGDDLEHPESRMRLLLSIKALQS